MNVRKTNRQKRVLSYLDNQLKKGIKYNGLALSPKDKERIQREIGNIKANLENRVKKKAVTSEKKDKDKWFIDIYSVKYGYVKQSERRKTKGKSRKGLKKTKSVSFLKSVVAHDGAITAYKEGRMGLSPKDHKFQLRKEEPLMF